MLDHVCPVKPVGQRVKPRDLSPGFAVPSPEGRDPWCERPEQQKWRSHNESLSPSERVREAGERSLGFTR